MDGAFLEVQRTDLLRLHQSESPPDLKHSTFTLELAADILKRAQRDLVLGEVWDVLHARQGTNHSVMHRYAPHCKIVEQAIRKAFTSKIGPYHSAIPRTQVTSIHVRVKHFFLSIPVRTRSLKTRAKGLMKIGNSGHTRGGRPFPRIDRNQNESRINSEYNPSIQK